MPAPNYQRADRVKTPELESRVSTAHFRPYRCALFHRRALAMSGMHARRVTELMAEFSREMCIVAKAAGISDLAERLARPKQCAPVQKVRGAIQAKRIDELAAGRATLRKELLNIA